MKKILTLLLLSIPCLIFAEEAVRTWKSKTGKTIIEAKWDSEKDSDPETVFLLKGKKRYKIPMKNLSEEDQKYVTDGRAKKAQRGGEEDFGLEEVTDEKPKNPLLFEMPKARKFALLVGVTDYAEMSGLTCCVKDIHAIRNQLIKLGFKENDIYTLESGKAAKELPTKRNVLERLDLVLGQVKVGDMVFFAFAGHGAETGREQYICPMETELDNLSETAVPIPLILEKLDASDARFKWLVVDACRNNPFNRRVSGATTLQGIDDPPKGVLLLQSCGQNEYSHEDPNLGQGLFTASFVEALSGKADMNQDGTLTLMEVCSYTTEATNRRALDLFRKYQRPYLNGDVTDFVLTEDLKRPKAQQFHAEALELFEKENYTEAKAKISEALKLYPQDAEYARLDSTIERFLKMAAEQERLAKEKAEAERKAREAAELAKKEQQSSPYGSQYPDIPAGRRVNISTSQELHDALDDMSLTDAVLVLAAGTYNLSDKFFIDGRNLSIYGNPANPQSVKIRFATGEYWGFIGGSRGSVVGVDVVGYYGIFITNSGTSMTLRNCVFHDCKKSGIFLYGGARADVRDCEIRNNKDTGVWCQSGATGTFRGNRLSGNSNGDWYISDCTITRTGNTPNE
ncbi:MAG: caspase family protein [Planctomycetia bacterium]|nr:caspase family protein [Planctomycetia bacterium]